MKLESLKNKKILILGFGREGKDTFNALRYLFPKKKLAIADQKKIHLSFKNIKTFFGKDYLKSLKKYQVIIKTPGIAFKDIKRYLKKNHIITSQSNLILNNFSGKIIGVTGTKGKGTTASLIYKVLKKANFNIDLGGNIGKPLLLKLVKKDLSDILVYEFSAQQLEIVNNSPYIALFLNLYPAHLNYFKDFESYKKAKSNIFKFQKKDDYLIFYKNQSILRKIVKKSKAQKIGFSKQRLNKFKKEIGKINLIGDFNFLNILAAFKVAKIFNINKKLFINSVKDFKGLPHRMEFVAKKQGIKFYNDSLATVPQATILGIKNFKNDLKTLILGGENNNLKLNDLVKEILKSNINNLILFPETGKNIKEILENKKSNINYVLVDNMERAVKLAFKYTSNGVCLLSPGAPSFNLFKNYKQRGDLYKKYVTKF